MESFKVYSTLAMGENDKVPKNYDINVNVIMHLTDVKGGTEVKLSNGEKLLLINKDKDMVVRELKEL